MKLKSIIFRIFLVQFCAVLFFNSVQAQDVPEKKSDEFIQATFISNFFNTISWENFEELESFNVGIIGDKEDLLYNELVQLTEKKKVKKLSIYVKRLENLSQLDNIQILYFDKSSGLDISDVYTATAGKHVLLVSKEYPYGKSMINFILVDELVRYELNENKCKAAGLTVSLLITKLAVQSEKEWDNLLDKIEYLADTDDKTVKIDTKDLAALIKEQKRLSKEIEANTKQLEQQKNKLKKQQAELTLKENELEKTKSEVNKQKALIQEQLQKISTQQENLAALNTNVVAKQEELHQQQAKLEEEKKNLLAIQEEYATIEKALKVKEILVKKQGKTIDEQGNVIVTKENKIEEQKTIIWLSILFLIIVSALGILAYRSYRLKNKANILISKQKTEIEEQHKILEEQHREITDSINYAKRIQDAILPPLKVVRGYMPDSFILYKPKDIVAGDFYWMEGVNNLIIFAAADCTGHGVPGAMVSVVCNNAMNRAVREFMLVEPHDILDKTREIVLETFEQSAEQVNDGMDIALCTLNTESNKLSFAGANNGLYLVRNGEIEQIKADKQPIGKYDDPQPFTLHEFDLEKGDVIYIFSDGFPDQFGGPKGKKFMYKPFREMLLSISDKPMDEQHNIIHKAFEDWRGNIEQIDDVCVIGVRI